MASVSPLVTPDEIVYRQIGHGGDPLHFDPGKKPPVHRVVFLPSCHDVDGLSLIRSQFRSEIWSAYRLERPDVRYRLIRLRVGDLIQIAKQVSFPTLTIDPSEDALDKLYGPPWAHCVIREINRTDYDVNQRTKQLVKEWAISVSGGVAFGDIIGPFRNPTPDDPYRP